MMKTSKPRIVKNENGQSTIEFLSVFTFALAIIFLFTKYAFNIANGYMVHYATFMAGRTYLVHDINSNQPNGSDGDAAKEAKNTFKTFYIEQFLKGSSDLKINDPENVANKVFTGVYYDFTQKFGVSRLLGGISNVEMRSEAFLGREPTFAECLDRICKAMANTSSSSCKNDTTITDDGC